MKTFTLLLATIGVCYGVEFKITNHHGGSIWVGIQGNSGKPALEGGGFNLDAGQTRTINSADDWAGRFWARTWCDDKTQHCQTGDCGNKLQCQGNGGQPPATLVEINLRADAGNDFYDVSLVDGFNAMALIRPVSGKGICKTLDCKKDLNKDCPNDLRVYLNNQSNQQVIGCKSACLLKNEPKYCCTGEYGPDKCNPNDWPGNINSGKYFKSNCPLAYSYAYEDKSSLYTCIANTYEIEFG